MDKETSKRVFDYCINNWILPEINKRKKYGKLPDDFKLVKAQIIFSVTRDTIKVRLNNEIKAIAKATTTRPIKKGELLTEADLNQIVGIELTEKDPNSAHITILLFKGYWVTSFDFSYNRNRIVKTIEAAREFYESAEENYLKNRLRPFIDNAFSCCELCAKSILLSFPDKNMIVSKSHREKKDKFQALVKSGNIEENLGVLYTELVALRPSARYLASNEYNNVDGKDIINKLRRFIESADNWIESSLESKDKR